MPRISTVVPQKTKAKLAELKQRTIQQFDDCAGITDQMTDGQKGQARKRYKRLVLRNGDWTPEEWAVMRKVSTPIDLLAFPRNRDLRKGSPNFPGPMDTCRLQSILSEAKRKRNFAHWTRGAVHTSLLAVQQTDVPQIPLSSTFTHVISKWVADTTLLAKLDKSDYDMNMYGDLDDCMAEATSPLAIRKHLIVPLVLDVYPESDKVQELHATCLLITNFHTQDNEEHEEMFHYNPHSGYLPRLPKICRQLGRELGIDTVKVLRGPQKATQKTCAELTALFVLEWQQLNQLSAHEFVAGKGLMSQYIEYEALSGQEKCNPCTVDLRIQPNN